MYKAIIFLTIGILTSACAEMATTYMPSSGNISGGYGEDKIKPDVYVVYFDGNGYVTQARAKKYFLRRASALTLQFGKSCFKVLDERRTLSDYFRTKAIETLGTKYYYKEDIEIADSDYNKFDENSLSGVIQMFPEGTDQKDCLNAKSTLQLSKSE
ncbi:MAG: hypothetical protein K0R29_2544 [Pseudobdellovibrio sp.]|jgi:hypothetical protein|nr:hypothetical protein [Pseudobdellovibrio sp.]